MTDAGSHPLTYTGYYDAERRPVRGVVPVEKSLVIYVNSEPLVSLACTPTHIEELALGFLFNEGLIEGLDEIEAVDLCDQELRVDVWLHHDIETPQLRTITSGCSGGATFEDMSSLHHRVRSSLCVTPPQVTQLMEEFEQASALYRRAGGVHGAALAEVGAVSTPLLCLAEDIGRHNALDKIAGICLRQGYSTGGCVLLTSGRISSEMVNKTVRMGVPIAISRTSPTSLSVQLAQEWGVTLIGYTRRHSFRVYTGAERVVAPK
ncbi:MAG: formate dehydrogenase accessory sulfurtransferase FdhD [Chloroflexi bacterium]|nr:MAG: formate dehydrogenase family accessory protein FdhD [Anaerolineaceae bacterium 4572_32.2]RLC74823.1 MAG: formate dehydrogenase accessory sulfurtransferase FdhD [Chloroflexota bacterium]RLC79122.1 MAG: formate dehydrogenase accessory sulfurtransferase FdhD [Chloroflexota bacterium]HEY72625.1 formate dehydrogenase accessory sulfurtransferase FdhD [Thermoflexia bacterium]